jgi:hypothetical protein
MFTRSQTKVWREFYDKPHLYSDFMFQLAERCCEHTPLPMLWIARRKECADRLGYETQTRQCLPRERCPIGHP